MAAADYPNQPWFALTYAPTLMAGPDGIYGVSYDVFTRPTEDPLPNGWEAHRSQTYKRIVEKLTELGFNHHQYSDYCNLDTDALSAWDAMAQIGRLPPPSKIATTLKGIKIHYMDDLNVYDATDELCLGGNLARHLQGPTPRNLVNLVHPQPLAVAPQNVPPGTHLPPLDTKRSATSTNPGNYLM